MMEFNRKLADATVVVCSRSAMRTVATANGVDSLSLVDRAKRAAARQCVDENVRSDQVIGVGTGSTIVFAVERLAEKYQAGDLNNLICVPTSFQARHLIIDNGLPLSDLERHWLLDVCIDGADEVDEHLNCIKGGGACLTQEKIVMSCARRFIVVADYRKISTSLGQQWTTIPLEVVQMAYRPIKAWIEKTEGGSVALRMAQKKAGPVVTDNNNFVLDWTFPTADPEDGQLRSMPEWIGLNQRLHMIPGVVETGLFLGMAERVYFGLADGSVKVLSEPTNSPSRGLYAVCDGNHDPIDTKAARHMLRACSHADRDCKHPGK